MVRWVLNDGVVPLEAVEGCERDEDGLCELDRFVLATRERAAGIDWEYDCCELPSFVEGGRELMRVQMRRIRWGMSRLWMDDRRGVEGVLRGYCNRTLRVVGRERASLGRILRASIPQRGEQSGVLGPSSFR